MIAWPTRLAEPAWLLLIPLVLLPWLIQPPALPWPDIGIEGIGRANFITRLRANAPCLLRSLAILLALVALARPQRLLGTRIEHSRGIAIVIALDRSASMSRPRPDATGPTPLQTAAPLLDAFVARRPQDLIGLVAFANWPDTYCPPTLDHDVLRQSIRSVPPATRAEDGTNLGDALAWACRDAMATEAARRVVILITDGRHEPDRSTVPNPLDPLEAAQLARSLGLIVHTIGIQVPGADLDEALLSEIATAAGGRSFLAATLNELDPVLRELDTLEPADLSSKTTSRYREDWPIPLAAALAALGLSALAARQGALP